MPSPVIADADPETRPCHATNPLDGRTSNLVCRLRHARLLECWPWEPYRNGLSAFLSVERRSCLRCGQDNRLHSRGFRLTSNALIPALFFCLCRFCNWPRDAPPISMPPVTTCCSGWHMAGSSSSASELSSGSSSRKHLAIGITVFGTLYAIFAMIQGFIAPPRPPVRSGENAWDRFWQLYQPQSLCGLDGNVAALRTCDLLLHYLCLFLCACFRVSAVW